MRRWKKKKQKKKNSVKSSSFNHYNLELKPCYLFKMTLISQIEKLYIAPSKYDHAIFLFQWIYKLKVKVLWK